MTKKINSKIIGCSIVKEPTEPEPQPFTRPPFLQGATAKLPATPHNEAATYITVNHDHTGRFVELFINTKDQSALPFFSAISRTASAVFRHEDDPSFLFEEWQEIQDPNGGYFRPPAAPGEKGRRFPSIMAEIGYTLQQYHHERQGMQQAFDDLNETGRRGANIEIPTPGQQCPKCNQFTLVKMDGCDTCTDCGWSKCG